jgi:NADH:ubiquinone oxidoreductase subunit C/predicted flap endonuclease-1-like 5' DNA nuclease
VSLQISNLPTLRQFNSGTEQVYHLRDGKAYRALCEYLFKEGYDFPQCLSGIDMEFGLRSVLHLRRLHDHAEVTIWLDMPYDKPHIPSVTDLWGGLEWHEREAYDLLGIHYDGHPDHRRILLEDHWTIHPLRRRYDTGGYLIPDWQPKAWPDWEALDREAEEADRKRQQAERAKAEAARAPAEATQATAESAGDLTQIRALNANYAAKLKEQGVTTLQALAALTDEQLEPLATAVGLKSPAAVTKWRDGAREIVAATKTPEVAPSGGDDLTQIKALNANYATKLREQGITQVKMLADLSDEAAEELATKVGLKSPAAVNKWREGARALLAENTATTPEVFDAPSPVEAITAKDQDHKDNHGDRDIAEIKTLNAKFTELLKAQGITTVTALAALPDERIDEIASAVGLKSSAAVKKWREGAQALLRGEAS